MVGSYATSADVCSLSSVSSNELDAMDNIENVISVEGSERKSGGGSGGRRGRGRNGSNIELACLHDKLPTDSDGEIGDDGNMEVDKGVGSSSWVRRGSGGSSTLRSSMLTGSRGGNGSRSFDYYGVASPPVGPSHLREYKTAGANATRVNTSVPEMDENFREKNEMIRKRRPRMEATLRGCRDIITDLFSRKHKEWTWPLLKLEKGQEKVKEPICLVDIKNKLMERKYSHADEVRRDVQKLVSNFCGTCDVNSTQYRSATQLSSYFEKEFAKMKNVEAKPRGRPPKNHDNAFAKIAAQRNAINQDAAAAAKLPLDLRNQAYLPLNRMGPSAATGMGGFAVGCAQPWKEWRPTQPGLEPRGNDSIMSSVIHSMVDIAKQSVVDESAGQDSVLESKERNSSENSTERCSGQDGQLQRSESESFAEFSGGSIPHSTPSKRVGAEENGNSENSKRPRVSENPVENLLRVIKTEAVSDEEKLGGDTRVLPNSVVLPNKSACKWILDGIGVVSGQEDVIKEIRKIIGADEHAVINHSLLSGLDGQVLVNVGEYVIRAMIHGATTGVGQTTTPRATRKEIGLAVGTLDATQKEWHRTQVDLSLLRESAYGMLQRINKMEEKSFVTLHELQQRKGVLNGCKNTVV